MLGRVKQDQQDHVLLPVVTFMNQRNQVSSANLLFIRNYPPLTSIRAEHLLVMEMIIPDIRATFAPKVP